MSESAAEGRYHIGAVARLTGLSQHTIRVWERRYGAVTPARSTGGTREYSDVDVDRLNLLRVLSESGHAISRIAGLDQGALNEMLASARRRGLVSEAAMSLDATTVASVMQSIVDLKVAEAERTLMAASLVLSPLSIVFDVIAPLVESIGHKWQTGELRVANEHAAIAILRTVLGNMLIRKSGQPEEGMAVVATISGELHEIGALMAAFVAMTLGWQVVYLGPNLPNTEICHVLDKTEANLLMLSLVNERSEESAATVRGLRELIPANIRILAGGKAVGQYTELFAASERVSDLRDLHARLARAPQRGGPTPQNAKI